MLRKKKGIQMEELLTTLEDARVEASPERANETWTYDMYYVKNKKQFLTFGQSTMGETISIDSENASRKEVTINGWKGQLNYKKKKKTIIWATDEYVFTVAGVGNISAEELLKVAKSVILEN